MKIIAMSLILLGGFIGALVVPVPWSLLVILVMGILIVIMDRTVV